MATQEGSLRLLSFYSRAYVWLIGPRSPSLVLGRYKGVTTHRARGQLKKEMSR